jgi:predicted esterase
MGEVHRPLSGSRIARGLQCALVVACAVLGGTLGRGGESEFHKALEANWTKAQRAYADKDYRGAARCYEKVCELLPFEPSVRYELARCHCRQGDKDKALADLEAAIRFGWSDPGQIEQADDLKELRDAPRFAGLVKDAVACRDETIVVYAGKNVDPSRPAPLVVLLQGLGPGPRAEVPYWKPVADRLGLVLAAPRAMTKLSPLVYGWQRKGARDSTALDYFDMSAAGKRIEEAIALAKQKFTIDPDRLLLAGFSQGGGVALRMLGEHPDQYLGAVAVCSLCQSPGVAYWETALQKRPFRTFVIAGKLDRLLPRSQQVVEQLRAAKVPLRYEEVDQAGHEYPPDYSERLRQAIQFVLGPEGRGTPG